MSEYKPDVWVIVEMSGTKIPKTYRRVLAGWFGGYTGANSWKLSSGIEEVIDRETHWEMPQSSGSVYLCHKESERFNSMTGSIYAHYAEQNTEEFSITHVPMEVEQIVKKESDD